jgi:hypothetical protein
LITSPAGVREVPTIQRNGSMKTRARAQRMPKRMTLESESEDGE